MNRVLVPSTASWYHGLRAVSYYHESELERWILTHAKSLFADYHVFPYKQQITSPKHEGPKKPDLAMIRKDFTSWAIIEVELENHDFEHIASQVNVFVTGDYNAYSVARYVQKQMATHCGTSVEEKQIVDLVSANLPTVIVMIDGERASLESELKQLGVGLCIFEIYKSTKPDFIFRTVGDYPQVPHKEVHCKRHQVMPNMLELLDSKGIKLGHKKEIDVRHQSDLTKWAVIKNGVKTYLRFLGEINPLNPNATLALCSESNGNLFFKYI